MYTTLWEWDDTARSARAKAMSLQDLVKDWSTQDCQRREKYRQMGYFVKLLAATNWDLSTTGSCWDTVLVFATFDTPISNRKLSFVRTLRESTNELVVRTLRIAGLLRYHCSFFSDVCYLSLSVLLHLAISPDWRTFGPLFA